MKKIVVLLISVILLTSGCESKKNNSKVDNKKNEQSSNITLDDQIVNDLSFENFAITKDSSNLYVIYFNITNKTDKSVELKNLDVKLYSEGATVLTLPIDINKTLEKDETIDVAENIDVKLKDIDKVEYVVE